MTNNRTIALFFLSALVTHIHAAQYSNHPTPPGGIWKAVETGNVDHVRAAIPNLSDPVDRISFQFNAKRSEDGNTPLHAAVERGQLAIVQLFIESKLFVTVPNDAGKTPLHLAVEHGHIAIAQELLTYGANPNEKDSGGDTALHTAAESGHAEVVQLLLNTGARVDTPSEDGMTALHIAAEYGDVKIMQLLLTRQANPHATDEGEETPLHKAARGSHMDAIRLLIQHNASVNAADQHGSPPLHMTARGGHVDAARLLIGHGASVKTANKNDITALYLAAKSGHVDTARLLLDHGAQVDAHCKSHWTPLQVAACYGHISLARLLLNHGAQVNARGLDLGFTPLHWAASKGDECLTMLLLQHGSSITATDLCEMTPLHHAAIKGKITTAQLLLDAGADLLAKTKQPSGKWTPLMLAVQKGRALLTQFFIRQGRAKGYNLDMLLGQDSVCGENASSWALHLAIERALSLNEDEEDVESNQKNSIQRGENLILCLLEAGGNPDNQHNGVGILHLAAEYGKGKIARMLLDHGANPNSEDTESNGNSIYLASQNSHRNMMRLLVARGAKPIHTVPANPQEAQFQTELAQIGHNRRQMFRQILRSKGLPFDLIRYMAQFAPLDIARQ